MLLRPEESHGAPLFGLRDFLLRAPVQVSPDHTAGCDTAIVAHRGLGKRASGSAPSILRRVGGLYQERSATSTA